MKSFFKQSLIILFFLLLSSSAFSSTVKWLLKPKYERIEIFCDDVFKCHRQGKVQLYKSSGDSLLPHPCDSITNFSEGHALILNKTDNGLDWAILGFFTEGNHKYTPIPEGYYTMRYSFFSDGLLAVGNAKNEYGYLDTQGREIIPCSYHKARPFIMGWASVQPEENRVIYINKSARPMIINFHHGEVNDGTSFNQDGKAVVIHRKTGDMAVINTRGEIVEKRYKRPKGVEKFYRNYDRAFCEDGKEFTPSGNRMPQNDPLITTFSSNGLYGYYLSDSTCIPAQFTYAGPFTNNCAVVSMGDHFGIITLTDGSISSFIKEKGKIVIAANNKISALTYHLIVPNDLPPVQVHFDKGDGTMNSIKLTNNTYSFVPIINKNANSCTIHAEIYSDGLLLKKDTFEKEIQTEKLRITVTPPSPTSKHADENNILNIKSSITNNSGTPIQADVTFSASFSANSTNNIVNPKAEGAILPGTTIDFQTSLVVKQTESIEITITVKVGNKKQTSSSIIQLIPYD